jgi:hypothetical protein
MNIETIQVSSCRGAFDRETRMVYLIEWLEHVRPDVMINDYNKKQLPAIMPHGVFYSRRQDTIQKHSGLVQIDIDGKHQSAGFNPENVVRDMEAAPYVVAGGISCMGEGVYMLIAVDGINETNHREKASRVMDLIEEQFNVVVDVPVTNNLSSLRFASGYAPYINYDVTPLTFEQ